MLSVSSNRDESGLSNVLCASRSNDLRDQSVTPGVATGIAHVIDEGGARWDDGHVKKQPDWSYDDEWSGKVPADVMADRRGPDADDY